MKHSPCSWTWHNLAGWSPQRIAAARRAVQREAEKVAALREQVGLFPEMQAEIQPRFTTVEERQQWADQDQIWKTQHFRSCHNKTWRKARRAFYALPALRRRGIRLLWNSSAIPKDPAYFAEFVRRYSTPGMSPWTHLRKVRIIWHWNHGGWPRPAHFRDITGNFDTLGPVKHPRMLTQSLIHIAQLQGISLRQAHSNRIPKHNLTTIYR